MAEKKPDPDKRAWLLGRAARCEQPPAGRDRCWRLVLLGAPGVGKGTQAELLAARLGGCALSTGDVLRTAREVPVAQRSVALTEAIGHMDRGELVPDQIMLELIAERAACIRCGAGFLLDGFPRTVAQAEALERLLASYSAPLDAVISFELPIATIVDRLGGRRTCSGCRAVYHLEARPPARPDLCDHCGQPLVQRQDDRPEAVQVRMAAYQRSTAPVINYYRRRGLLIEVSADGPAENILSRTWHALAVHTPARAAG